MSETDELVKKVARALAAADGGRMVGPGRSKATREFKWEGDGGHLERYVAVHWQEWTNAAQFAIDAGLTRPSGPPSDKNGKVSDMTIDEFRNALRILLNDAIKGGIDIDDLLEAADQELHPAFDMDAILSDG